MIVQKALKALLQGSTDATGLEPVTDRLEGGCSIQLSYASKIQH